MLFSGKSPRRAKADSVIAGRRRQPVAGSGPDAWVVGFGFSRVLLDLRLMQSPWAYSVMAVTILIDVYLLYIFFTGQQEA